MSKLAKSPTCKTPSGFYLILKQDKTQGHIKIEVKQSPRDSGCIVIVAKRDYKRNGTGTLVQCINIYISPNLGTANSQLAFEQAQAIADWWKNAQGVFLALKDFAKCENDLIKDIDIFPVGGLGKEYKFEIREIKG